VNLALHRYRSFSKTRQAFLELKASLVLIYAKLCPFGYEDEQGFHHGMRKERSESASEPELRS
jgi:hypothetical protein